MKKNKKYKFNKEKFSENMFIATGIVVMNIYLFYVLNNIEFFITTL